MSFLILFPISKFFFEAKCILIIFSISFYYLFHKQKWEMLTSCCHSWLMIAEQQSWIPWTIFGKPALLLYFLILKWHRFLESSNGVPFWIFRIFLFFLSLFYNKFYYGPFDSLFCLRDLIPASHFAFSPSGNAMPGEIQVSWRLSYLLLPPTPKLNIFSKS